jgi:phosphoglycerol transferase MdoB-like AlkP superfamily enzyme
VHNAQQETNLHNLRFYGVKLNKLIFGKGLALGLLVYLGILPLLYRRRPHVRAWVDRLALPLIRAPYLLIYLGALAFLRIPLSVFGVSQAMEMGEFVGVSILLLTLTDPLNPGALAPLPGGGPARSERRAAGTRSPHALVVVALLGTCFALFALYRVAFWLAFRGPESAATPGELWHAFTLGLRFDLRLATLLVLPLLALGWLRALDPLRSRGARAGWVVYFTALIGASTLIYFADFAHYGWVDRRIDVSVMEYAYPVGTALRVIWESYPVFPLVLALAAFLWGWGMITRRCIAWAAARSQGDLSPRREAPVMLSLVPVLAIALLGRLGGYPLRWSHAFFTPDAFASALGLNPVLYLIDTWPHAQRGAEVDVAAAQRAAIDLASYLEIDSPAAQQIDLRRHVEPVAPLPGRPNVVVIQLESFGANKVGLFGNPLDPTPNFDRVAREAMLFTAYYTASRGTARSTFSLLTGIPDVTHRGSRNPLIVDQHVLVDEFQGYEKMYFYTGDLAWGNIRGLLQNNIDGLRVFEEKDYHSPHNDGWGISDLALFEEANAVFRKLGDRPFIAFLHTSGNHRPYTIPADRRGFVSRPVAQSELIQHGFRSQEEFDSLHFMDHAVGQFLEIARREPYFERTLFLIFGDHGSRGSGTSAWQKIGLTAIHVPFVIYAPKLIPPRRIDEPISSLDVLPTVAALVGVPYVNTTLGRNALAPRRDGESYVFSEGGLVDRDFFYTGTSLHQIHAQDPTVDVSEQYPERRQQMANVWEDFRTLSLYLMHNNDKKSVLQARGEREAESSRP